MDMSSYLAKALLNQVFRNTAYSRPSTVFIALYISNPTASDTGQEVTGGDYVRQAVVFSAPIASNGAQAIKNSAEVPFPVASADWGLVTHVGIRDAATGGNLLYFGGLANPRTILTGDILKFAPNKLELTLS